MQILIPIGNGKIMTVEKIAERLNIIEAKLMIFELIFRQAKYNSYLKKLRKIILLLQSASDVATRLFHMSKDLKGIEKEQ